MPASLRKACHACTQAKRKCHPQLPKCNRCLKNGIECNYDLEPVTHLDSEFQPPINIPKTEPSTAASQPTYSVFASVESAHQAAIQTFNKQQQSQPTTELRIVADEEILVWALHHLRQIPDLIAQNKPSPFVHAQVYQDNKDAMARMNHVLKLHESISQNPTSSNIVSPSRNIHLQHLIRTGVAGLSMTDVLISIYELTLYLIIYLCNDLPPSYQAEAERYLDLVMDWTKHLWTTVPDQLSSTLSQWQAWAIAESARRTIIASFLVKSAVSILRYGYCVYENFLESLPFDRRKGLWEAMSEEEWQAAVDVHGGKGADLVSFREFTVKSDPSHIREEGLFQKMLLLGYHGRKGLAVLNGD